MSSVANKKFVISLIDETKSTEREIVLSYLKSTSICLISTEKKTDKDVLLSKGSQREQKQSDTTDLFVTLNAVQEAVAMGRKCGSMPVKIDEFEVKGYRVHRGRYTLACLALVITFGLLWVLLVWRKDIKMWMFYKECSLEHATKILVKVSILNFFSIIKWKQENNICKKR